MSEVHHHQLKVVNRSSREWIFYVYQTIPFNESMFSLAWLISPYKVPVNDTLIFGWPWAVDYQFLWSRIGTLTPGAIVRPNQERECKPSGKNHTEFTVPLIEPPDYGQLSEPFKAPYEGILYIKDGPTVPDEKFAVGIGTNGTGAIVQQAKANLIHEFLPQPTYWVAAAEEMRVGTVLDNHVMRAAKLPFSHHIHSVVAILTQDDTWKITTDQFGDTNTSAGDSTTTTTTTTTTNTHTTTYNCCAII